MLRLRAVLESALCELLMGNDELSILRDVADCTVRDRDIRVTRFLELLAQSSSAKSRRAHTSITSVDDALEFITRNLLLISRQIFAAVLHLCHGFTSSLERFFAAIIMRTLDEDGSDRAGNSRSNEEICDICEECAFRRHGENCEDGARRCRSDQAAAEEIQREDTRHAASDDSENEDRLHEDIREVDFVDTTENVNDHGARRGIFCHAFAEEPVREQDTEARARVCLEQEEHGLAVLLCLLDAERREDAVVDCVIEEQDLGRLDDDRGERQQAHGDDGFNASTQDGISREDDRADAREGQDSEDTADDAGREVVYQHLKTGRDMVFDGLIELLDDPAAQRAHDHGAEEHRDVRTCDDTGRRNRAEHAAAMTVDSSTAAVAEKQWDQPLAHRCADLSQVFIRPPARRDEQGRQKAPSDECANIRQDHSGKEAAKLLHGFLSAFFFLVAHKVFPPFSLHINDK